METTIRFLLLASPVISLALLVAWVIAERANAPLKRRIGLGVVMLVTALPLAVAFAAAITQLDDQSYFAAAVRTMLDESIDAIESGEAGFLQRIKSFRDQQMLNYETRGNLLENARNFRDEGRRIREQKQKTEPAAGPYGSLAAGSPSGPP